jgi:hypothetical protein
MSFFSSSFFESKFISFFSVFLLYTYFSITHIYIYIYYIYFSITHTLRCLERGEEAVLIPYSERGAEAAYHDYEEGEDSTSFQEGEDEEGMDFSDTNNWGGGRWHERKDEKGAVYYWNETSGEISWEKPLWVEEV